MEDKYKQISTEENYHKLLKSGMFFEFYPELVGKWDIDNINFVKEPEYLKIIRKLRLDLFHEIANKYGERFANEYSSIVQADKFIANDKVKNPISLESIVEILQTKLDNGKGRWLGKPEHASS